MTYFFKTVLACLAMGGLQLSAMAQNEWPKAKPVTLVVAFAPGASTDIVARSLTQKLSEITGGNFMVDNKGGAGGNIAASWLNALRPMAIPCWFTVWPLRSTPRSTPMQATMP